MATKSMKPKKNPFYARLGELGCTFCDVCHAFMYPDHREHITVGLAVDTHTSRYAVVGGYGSVRLTEVATAKTIYGEVRGCELPPEVDFTNDEDDDLAAA